MILKWVIVSVLNVLSDIVEDISEEKDWKCVRVEVVIGSDNVSEVTKAPAALAEVCELRKHSSIKNTNPGPGWQKQGHLQNDKGPSESETSHCSQQ